MLFRLILLFTILPVVEIYLLFKLAQATSWTGAIVIVIATGVVGATLAKIQGLAVWRRVGDCLRRGELPADALIEGLIIFFGGVVLITPGLLTDFVGLLTPLFRPLAAYFVTG